MKEKKNNYSLFLFDILVLYSAIKHNDTPVGKIAFSNGGINCYSISVIFICGWP